LIPPTGISEEPLRPPQFPEHRKRRTAPTNDHGRPLLFLPSSALLVLIRIHRSCRTPTRATLATMPATPTCRRGCVYSKKIVSRSCLPLSSTHSLPSIVNPVKQELSTSYYQIRNIRDTRNRTRIVCTKRIWLFFYWTPYPVASRTPTARLSATNTSPQSASSPLSPALEFVVTSSPFLDYRKSLRGSDP
jgi:hypothetical protein